MNATTYTRFSATIHLPTHQFPLGGRIEDQDTLLVLANNGTTPGRITPRLQTEAARIRDGLLAGQTVTTRTATISPRP